MRTNCDDPVHNVSCKSSRDENREFALEPQPLLRARHSRKLGACKRVSATLRRYTREDIATGDDADYFQRSIPPNNGKYTNIVMDHMVCCLPNGAIIVDEPWQTLQYVGNLFVVGYFRVA